ELKVQGYPVEFIIPSDGTTVQDNAVGMVKGARNPELARKFIEFILSPEMQRIGAEYLYTPVRPGVLDADSFISLENLAKSINVLLLPDQALAEEMRPEIQARWESYMR